MKKQIDLYIVVSKKLGPIRDMLYFNERNAVKEFQHWDKDSYSLCKYSVTAVLEDDEWVDMEDLK